MSVYNGKECNGKSYNLYCNRKAADIPPADLNISKEADVKEEREKNEGVASIIDELFGNVTDPEKLFIAALVYLLIKEGADMKLILALGYILL